MIQAQKIGEMLEHLQLISNNMANDLEIIRKGMTGKGISPDKSPLVEMKIEGIERKLRMLGANKDNPIPF